MCTQISFIETHLEKELSFPTDMGAEGSPCGLWLWTQFSGTLVGIAYC